MNNTKTELETLIETNRSHVATLVEVHRQQIIDLKCEIEALRKALHGIETVLDFERQDRVRAEAELAALKYPRAYIPPGGERTEALMAIAISQAEERGAKWAVERHGNPFASKTLEQYAAEICRDARVKP
jgi:uncharacterized membrane protein